MKRYNLNQMLKMWPASHDDCFPSAADHVAFVSVTFPLRSPYLNSLDVYLREYLKSLVYETIVPSALDLKVWIIEAEAHGRRDFWPIETYSRYNAASIIEHDASRIVGHILRNCYELSFFFSKLRIFFSL